MTQCPHHHHHDHDDDLRSPMSREMDPAAKSLADALRVSFRLLAVIMIFVLIAFALTGIQSVEPQEQGIIKVFGRYVGVAKPGLVYNWPFPIGEIEIVPVREETITVDDFWLHELPADRTIELSERRAPREGLRPGWDGMLITGDRYLLHVRLSCNYRVQDPMVVRLHAADLPQLIRTAVANAAIRAAATRTADAILSTAKQAFLSDIEDNAEQELRLLLNIDDPSVEGVDVTSVYLGRSSLTVPLAALAAYNGAQQAQTAAQKQINAAKGEAETTVNEAAGVSYRALVGDPYQQVDASQAASQGQRDLIGQYNRARQAGNEAKAQTLLQQIDEVLLSNDTSGQAARILAQARAEKTDKIEQARSRYQRYAQLLDEFNKSPEFLIQRYWAEVREAILESPLVEKVYVPRSDQKTIFRINRDPEVAKEIERELLKSKEQSPG